MLGKQCVSGVCQNPNCTLGQTTTVQNVLTTVAKSVQVKVSGTATTKKFLVNFSKTTGACQWAVFIRGASDAYGLMVYSFGANTNGGWSDCPIGTDTIPEGIMPGDELTVTGKTVHYAPTSCTVPPSPQIQVDACQVDKTGSGSVPTPILVSNPDDLTTGNPLYQGNLVQLTNVDAQNWDAGTVGPYGIIRLVGTSLEIHDMFYYPDQGAPQFGPSQHFNKIVGINHLDYCTWALQPRDKCLDLDPKSLDCP
jgi:hypothetical protein